MVRSRLSFELRGVIGSRGRQRGDGGLERTPQYVERACCRWSVRCDSMTGSGLVGPLGHLTAASSGSAVCVRGCVCPVLRNLEPSWKGWVWGGEAWGAAHRWFLIAESALNVFCMNLF